MNKINHDKHNRGLAIIIYFVLSLCTSVAVGEVSGLGITRIDIILPLVFVFSFCIYKKAFSLVITSQIRDRVLATVLGLMVSISVVAGAHVKMYNSPREVTAFGVMDIFCLGVIFIFAASLILLAFSLLDGLIPMESPRISIGFPIILVLLILMYMPYYLTFYPGNLGKDSFESVEMILSKTAMTNHQPVFFTFLYGIVILPLSGLVGIKGALGVFSLIHMCIFALSNAYMLSWLKRRKVSSLFWWAAFLFVGLHPFMGMYSVYITKDVLFGCILQVMVLKLIDLREGCSKINIITIGLLCLGASLLRNNGIYITVSLGVGLFAALKSLRKPILITFLVVYAAFAIYKGPVFSVLGIQPESFAEAASIPLQQIANVIVNNPEAINAGDREYLEDILPFEETKEAFTLGYTDTYKFHENFDDALLNATKGQFMGVWFRLLRRSPREYISAYMAQTCGYWHYGETNTVATEGVVDNSLGVKGEDIIQNISGYSLRPAITAVILGMRKAPVITLFSSMAVMIFTVFFIIAVYLRYNSGALPVRLLAMLPLIVLWLSLMVATPAYCLLRYMFPFFMLWPVLVCELAGKCHSPAAGSGTGK